MAQRKERDPSPEQRLLPSRSTPWFDQVPLVAVEILEHSDGAVRFVARRLEEIDAGGKERLVVAREVIRLKEEADASTGLVPDPRRLFLPARLGKEQGGPVAARRDDDPALAFALRLVGDELEAERTAIIDDGLVVV